MKKDKICYLTPEIEILNIITEQQCITASLGGTDPNPNNPGENPTPPETDEDW